MNRRKFLGSAAVGLVLQHAAIANSAAPPPPARHSHTPEIQQQLRSLQSQYHADLFDDFLPFMEKFVIDPVYGGFMCSTDGNGMHTDTNKAAWYEGRGIWVYSFLYNHLAREQKYLDVARRSADFILSLRPKTPDTTWPKSFSRDGKKTSPPDVEVYGNMFIAEGLAEFSVAANDSQYWNIAREIFLSSVRIYDREDYNPLIGRTYLTPDARPFPGARIQGVWMTFVRTATQMLRIRPDAEIEAIAHRAVDAVVNHHWNPRFNLNNELLNHDLSRPTNEYEQLVYTGHGIETLWMMMDEATRRRDAALFATLTDRFQRHVEVSRDRIYDGVFRDLMHVDNNTWTLDKVLWAQCEVTIGALLAYQETGAPWAWDIFRQFDTYTRTKFSLKSFGIPLWMYAADRQVTPESYFKQPARVEHYHYPRHLMLNLLRINSLLQI